MTYVGIDPGASGGIAVIAPHDSWAFAMPETEKDVAQEIEAISGFSKNIRCLLERVHAMPGQGVTSMFNFGMNYGMLRMSLCCHLISFDDVTPQKWQKGFSLPSLKKAGTNTAKKNAHKARAQQLFPKLKVTHKIADALLIAEYCRRIDR